MSTFEIRRMQSETVSSYVHASRKRCSIQIGVGHKHRPGTDRGIAINRDLYLNAIFNSDEVGHSHAASRNCNRRSARAADSEPGDNQ